MSSNSYTKAVFICVVTLVTVTIAFMMFSGSSTLLQNLDIRHLKSLPFDRGHRQKFIYSTSKIWKTILRIQDKNCRIQETSDNSENCLNLRKCNAARSRDLPKTCRQRLPHCIIIGVFKAGTRELIDFLSMHPDVVIRRYPSYEISFFSTIKWSQGFDWYRKQMPFSLGHQITIEKSPAYFTNKHAPNRIWQMNPYVRLILIVGNPVDRIVSHMTFAGRNISADFALGKNITGRETYIFQQSFYDEPFERYLLYFNRSQIHIVDSARFKYNRYHELHKIETFLSLQHRIDREDIIYNKDKGFYCLKDVNRTTARCFGDERGRKKTSIISDTIRPALSVIFKPHNERFYNLSGQTFLWS